MLWPSLLTTLAAVVAVRGHGRVLEPPSRASAWRLGFPTAHNYDDDGINCGGFSMQWSVNGGKCGICGDAYNIPPPRPHELGGIYGDGTIVAHYLPGSLITTTVDLTAYHRGFWEFKLCPDPENNEQECFDQHVLELESGETKYYPSRGSAKYNVSYKLPEGLVCEHCVLQWRYTAGNNWGTCKNGTQGLGCGNQEQFGACSDITIGFTRTKQTKDTLPEGYEAIPNPLFYYLKYGYFDAQQGLLHLLSKGFVLPHQNQNIRSEVKTQLQQNQPKPTRLNTQTESTPTQQITNYRPKPSLNIETKLRQNQIRHGTESKPRTKPMRYKDKRKRMKKNKKKFKHRKRKKKITFVLRAKQALEFGIPRRPEMPYWR